MPQSFRQAMLIANHNGGINNGKVAKESRHYGGNNSNVKGNEVDEGLLSVPFLPSAKDVDDPKSAINKFFEIEADIIKTFSSLSELKGLLDNPNDIGVKDLGKVNAVRKSLTVLVKISRALDLNSLVEDLYSRVEALDSIDFNSFDFDSLTNPLSTKVSIDRGRGNGEEVMTISQLLNSTKLYYGKVFEILSL